MHDPVMYNPTALLRNLRAKTDHILALDPSQASVDALDLADRIVTLDDRITDGGDLPEQWRRSPRQGRPPLTTPGVVLDDARHGTSSGYNAGCRCTDCRSANAQAAVNSRARAKNRKTTLEVAPQNHPEAFVNCFFQCGFTTTGETSHTQMEDHYNITHSADLDQLVPQES